MNHNDINIEELVREYSREEAATPPAAAWQKIQDNMVATPQTVSKRKSPYGLWVMAGALIMAALAIWQVAMVEDEKTSTVAAVQSVPSILQVAAVEAPSVAESVVETPPAETRKPQLQEPHKATTVVDAASTPSLAVPSSPSVVESLQAAATSNDIVLAEPSAVMEQQEILHAATPLPSQPALQAETSAPIEEEPVAATRMQEVESTVEEEKSNLFIPNLLTPNGDGINDYWVIPALTECEDVQVAIFTAQGKRVYTNNHYHGEFSGSDLAEGSYYYQIVVNSAQIKRRGVLVIRK